MTYVVNLSKARNAVSQARTALDKATSHVAPPTPEMHALFMQRPEAYAECLRKMADILATIPSLRESLKSSEAILAELEKVACYRCNGSGRYEGPTNATRKGVPYCFYCDGHGYK